MGRIHRYGQKHDPVVILNLVAPKTREGRVLKTLLDKLEKIRKELRSRQGVRRDRPHVRGRVHQAVHGAGRRPSGRRSGPDLDGRLTAEQVDALAAREKIAVRHRRRRGDRTAAAPRRDRPRNLSAACCPATSGSIFENAAPLAGIEIDGDLDGCFSLRSGARARVDPLLHVLETYPDVSAGLAHLRPSEAEQDGAIWLHPGEPMFEAFRAACRRRVSRPTPAAGRCSLIPPPRSPSSSTWAW